MHKNLIVSALATAMVGVTGAATAQSSVTLFGVVDTSLQYLSASGAGSQTRLDGGGYRSNRLGFRGVEDLGNGLKANFWLEAGYSSDTGAGAATNTNNQLSGATKSSGLTFNRRSTMGMSGSFGEFRVGRDYSPAFNSISAYDVFGTIGVAGTPTLTQALASRLLGGTSVTNVRVSNSLAYFLPNTLGGLYGSLMVGLGENTDKDVTATVGKKDGNFVGASMGYKQGPWDVRVAYGRVKVLANDDYQDMSLGGSYDFGSVKVQTLLFRERVGLFLNPVDGFNSGGRVTNDSWNIGAVIPVGTAGKIRTSFVTAKAKSPSYSRLADGKMYNLGYVYDFSKRTSFYTTLSYVKNNKNAYVNRAGTYTNYYNGRLSTSQGGSSTGFEVGLSHLF